MNILFSHSETSETSRYLWEVSHKEVAIMQQKCFNEVLTLPAVCFDFEVVIFVGLWDLHSVAVRDRIAFDSIWRWGSICLFAAIDFMNKTKKTNK